MLRPLHLPTARRLIGAQSLHSFTRAHLEAIRAVLDPVPSFAIPDAPRHTAFVQANGRPPADSAVLIPLMNINDAAHILLQIRSPTMRVHAGEASFPGGKADPEDATLVDTALRETQEELAIPPTCVEVLGALKPEYSLGNRARVWPIVGFVHATPDHADPNLTSPDLSSIVPSPAEVSAILPLPLSALGPPRQAVHFFRLAPTKPYWKIRADDLVIPPTKEPLEIWGLSGWFLNCLAWRTGWMSQPEAKLPED